MKEPPLGRWSIVIGVQGELANLVPSVYLLSPDGGSSSLGVEEGEAGSDGPGVEGTRAGQESDEKEGQGLAMVEDWERKD